MDIVIGRESDIVSLRYAGAECLFMALLKSKAAPVPHTLQEANYQEARVAAWISPRPYGRSACTGRFCTCQTP